MTSNEYAKAQSICAELATAATNLVNAVDALIAIRSKKDSTGFDLTDNGFRNAPSRDGVQVYHGRERLQQRDGVGNDAESLAGG
jgi:hypothetical protein